MSSKNIFLNREKFQQYILLLLILAVAVILRTYNYTNIPYTHDELSALFRTGYWNISELIEHGVIMDGHPAGIQVFMNYYILLFGNVEWVVKLPFLIFGIASVYLIYQIANFCFGKTSAAVTAIFLATLQFPIMYSQIARPYISGLFFILLMAWFWLKYFFDPEKKYKIFNLVGFVIAGILCSYNHYFSLLSAIIIGLTGIFFLKKKNLLPYIFSGIIIFLAFLPHLKIFFTHLSMEGLGWLGAPTPDFFFNCLGYIFHFSLFTYCLILLIIATSGYFSIKYKSSGVSSIQIIFLMWFMLPLLIGYFYSIYVEPVLQFSVLIFSFSFLLLFLFSFLPDRTFKFNLLAIGLIAAVNILTLIFEREHYKVFYEMQPIQQFAVNSKYLTEKVGSDSIYFYIDQNPRYLGYYWENKMLAAFTSIYNKGISPVEFRKQVQQHQEPYLAAGVVPQEYYNIIQETYPYLIFRDIGLGYEYYGYSKVKPVDTLNIVSYSKTLDSTIFLDSLDEWGPGLKIPVREMNLNIYSLVDISVKAKSAQVLDNVLLSCHIKSEEKEVWMSIPLSKYMDRNISDWQKVYLSFRMTHVVDEFEDIADGEMNIFIWNKGFQSVQLDELKVEVREGNKYVYALTSDFH